MFGIKVTCADVGASCDDDCMREKYDKINELGNPEGNYLWDRCNIYISGKGCRHVKEGEDIKKSCCGVPVKDGDKPAPALWEGRPNLTGEGICMPVDVEKTDGKVTTTSWEDGKYLDKTHQETAGWGKVEKAKYDAWKKANPDAKCDFEGPKYAIPSVTIELECSATRMFASAAAAIAVAALI